MTNIELKPWVLPTPPSNKVTPKPSGIAVQFGNSVTQPFLSRSDRVPTTEVGCLSFTQMFQDYFHEYPPLSQADAYYRIQEMAQRLDMYLNRYPAQYINCMTSDSEFVAFLIRLSNWHLI